MNLNDATDCVPAAVALKPVFTIGSQLYTWVDVVRAAEVRGSWQALVNSVRAGVVANAYALSINSLPTTGEIEATTTKFRYEFDLIAGDDLLKWLTKWGISALDWEESLCRNLSRQRFSSALDALAPYSLDEDSAISSAIWPEAVCTRFVERAGWQFSADVALALGSIPEESARVPGNLRTLQAAADVARAVTLTPEALMREVASHRLDWMSLRGWRLQFSNEDIAKEAAMCARTDGSSLTDIGRACGVNAEEFNVLLTDLDAVLSSKALAAEEGDLIGPIRLGKTWVILTIERKIPPSLDDPLVLQRARERIIRSAEERAINRSVRWHEFY